MVMKGKVDWKSGWAYPRIIKYWRPIIKKGWLGLKCVSSMVMFAYRVITGLEYRVWDYRNSASLQEGRRGWGECWLDSCGDGYTWRTAVLYTLQTATYCLFDVVYWTRLLQTHVKTEMTIPCHPAYLRQAAIVHGTDLTNSSWLESWDLPFSKDGTHSLQWRVNMRLATPNTFAAFLEHILRVSAHAGYPLYDSNVYSHIRSPALRQMA